VPARPEQIITPAAPPERGDAVDGPKGTRLIKPRPKR
jgi:hypothetical protein